MYNVSWQKVLLTLTQKKFKESMKYLSPYMLLQVKNNFDANEILIKKTIKNEEKASFKVRNYIEKKLKY